MLANRIHVHPDHASQIAAAASRWVALAKTALAIRGVFHVALAGGSTPAALYRQLGDPALTGQLDWSRVHVWFGDERCVDPGHPDSNYRMANESLLRHVPLAHNHVHRIPGEAADRPQAARDYGRALTEACEQAAGFPVLDLVLLGIGMDGHIASLFPGSDTLQETKAHVSAAHIDEEKGWRISLTLPVIRHARHVMVLASGAAKADILSRVLSGSHDAAQLPASLIRDLPQIEWFLDRAAAAEM